MATFVEVLKKSGEVHTKAVCRLRVNGVLANRCKTFPDRQQAEEWALSMERAMRGERENPRDTFDGMIKTVSGALDRLAVLRDKSQKLFSVDDLYQYLAGRKEAGASEKDIELDAELLYMMLRLKDQETGGKSVRFLQMALNKYRMEYSRIH